MLRLVLLAALAVSALALESDWNQEMRNYILEIHNDYRRNEGGCQINKLEYDMDLENQAKRWAEGCVFKHEMIEGRGENLAWDSNHNPEKDLIKDSAQRWFDEKKMYSYGQSSCGNSCHYTQLVWGNTEKVGCYTTRCPNLQYAYRDAWYLVCFYTPMGNWIGEKPYEKSCSTPCHEGQHEENGLCVGKAIVACVDGNASCGDWASRGECERNPDYMKKTCKKSCNSC